MIEFFIEVINPIAWVLANVILAYTALILVVFVFMYYALFNPKATTGGQLIFRFMVSLVGVVGVVFLGIFIDPAPDHAWFIYPAGHVDAWRPALRLLIYGYVAFTATALSVLLIKRKWFPHMLRIAPSQDLIKPRHETSEIPVVGKSSLEGSDNAE